MYPADLEADVVLSDGGTVHIRPIRADDGERLLAFHGRLSAETIYYRFFSAHPRLSDAEVERFTHVDYADRLALIALLADDMVAVARFDRYQGEDRAEVAFVVDDAHHGRGLGTVLLEHLAVAARDRGIHRFVAEVLPDNRRMIGVFRAAGFEVSSRFADGVVEVNLGIDPTEDAARAIAERERVAESRSVQRLLAPRSIAVIGAGRARGTIGHEIFRNLLAGGFVGPVYPVNRAAPWVASVRAFPSVLDVPDPVDVAVITVPAADVRTVVEQCGRKRVTGLVVVSAGFSDVGPAGRDAERELVALARSHGMRLIGPSCMGVVNTADDVAMHATFAKVQPPRGRVAFSSQSGALGAAILAQALRLDVGISTFVAVGNKADVSGNDLLQYWEADPGTDVVLLYLESFGNPRKFSRIARRVSTRKPIVAVKAGRGAGTGGADRTDVAVDALFLQTGVIRVDTLAQLFDVARVLVDQPLPGGRRVAIVANASGPGALAADACAAAELHLADLSASTMAALAPLSPARGAGRNPVELPHTASAADYGRAVAAVLADPAVDAVLALFVPPLVESVDDTAHAIGVAAVEAPHKPVLTNFIALGPDPAALRVGDRRIPSFAYPEEAAHALGRVAAYAEWRRRPHGLLPHHEGVADADARRLVDEVLEESPEGVTLHLPGAAPLLACYGIDVVPTAVVRSADEACTAAASLGFPVALKLGGRARVFRGEAGGVALDLQDDDDVRRTFERMAAYLGERMGDAVVQRMAMPGIEVSTGIVPHRSFGPLVKLGLGGRAVAARDHAHRVVPLTDVDAAELVRTMPGAAEVLAAGDGAEAAAARIEDLVLRLGVMADDLPEIAELSLAPVIVSDSAAAAAVAVDATLTLVPWRGDPEPLARRLP